MKKAKNAKFIYNKKNECIGINLGFDFVAEHEFGINEIKKMFGLIDFKEKDAKTLFGKINTFVKGKKMEPIFGIDKRTINKIPYPIQIQKIIKNKKTYYVLIVDNNSHNDKLPDGLNLNYFDKDMHREEVGTAWDNHSFGIIVDKTHKKDLAVIEKAFNELDIVIDLSNAMVFENSGLVLMKKSAINEELASKFYQKDKDIYNSKQKEE